MVLQDVLILFFYTELSSFPSTIYWRDCLLFLVYSWLFFKKSSRTKHDELALGRTFQYHLSEQAEWYIESEAYRKMVFTFLILFQSQLSVLDVRAYILLFVYI